MIFLPDMDGNLAGRGGGTVARGKGSEARDIFFEGDVEVFLTLS